MKITMTQFVDNMQAIPAYANMSKRGVRQLLDLFVADVVKNIEEGNEVVINGLGKISTKKIHKPAHQARNPRTGEPVKVPAKNSIRTRLLLDKALRERMAA